MVVALWNVSDPAWSAIAAWVGLVLAVVGAIYAYKQFKVAEKDRTDRATEAERQRAERELARDEQAREAEQTRAERERVRAEQAHEAQQVREEEAQPYVVIYAEPTPERPHVVDLVVRNLGATVAKDINISVTPTLFRHAGGSEEVELPDVIRTLVPGQEWRTFWDGSAGTLHLHEDPHTATIYFRDARDRDHGPYTFVLDWSHIAGRMFPSPAGIPELTKAVQETRDLLKGWKRHGNDALRVHTYDGDEYDKREREHWEQRRQEADQRQADQSQGAPPESPADLRDAATLPHRCANSAKPGTPGHTASPAKPENTGAARCRR